VFGAAARQGIVGAMAYRAVFMSVFEIQFSAVAKEYITTILSIPSSK
jgi:hypothetical protein